MSAGSPLVVLDASVIYPVTLCDTLLRAAEAGFFQPRWSEDILAELIRNLAERIGGERAMRRANYMRAAFPGATVAEYQDRLGAMTNHPKDRHVVAAAVTAGARLIVTSNIRHFPAASLAPHRVEAQTPDAFLLDLLDADPGLMRETLIDQAADLRNPPSSLDDVLTKLAAPAPAFARRVRADLVEFGSPGG